MNCHALKSAVQDIEQVMVNSEMDQLPGNGMTKEKVSVLLEPLFYQTFPVFPNNPETFGRYSL